jgi:signal peptidase I
MKPPGKARLLKLWREWGKPFLIVAFLTCSFRSAVADWNYVPSGSMKPTIVEGDRIFVNRLAYDLKVPFTTWRLLQWADPQRGDVVVLYSPADEVRLVKRVVAVAGDTVALRGGRLIINGETADYESLEDSIRDQISADEQPRHLFFRENLLGQSHPIMWTPESSGFGDFGPVAVPEGQFFVMGDNRDNSRDSRVFGFVDRFRILGRASGVAISVDPSSGYRPRWSRFFRSLP